MAAPVVPALPPGPPVALLLACAAPEVRLVVALAVAEPPFPPGPAAPPGFDPIPPLPPLPPSAVAMLAGSPGPADAFPGSPFPPGPLGKAPNAPAAPWLNAFSACPLDAEQTTATQRIDRGHEKD